MRILTEQELRRAVDSTVRRTLAENSQNEGLGKWLLGGAAALLGLHYWPQIKNFIYGQDGSGGQTPPQEPSSPSSGTGSGNTDIVLPTPSGSSDGQLEDWQKEWRGVNGQNKPASGDTTPQTRPSSGPSELDKVDALLNNPMALRQMSRSEIRLLLMYRMMLSSDNSRSSNIGHPNDAYRGYAKGHRPDSPSRTRTSRSVTRPSTPSRGYAPGHRRN